MPGAALTIGEEQEQVFGKMSRNGNVTKYMGKASKFYYLSTVRLIDSL